MSFERFISENAVPEVYIAEFEAAKKRELESLRTLVVANTPPLVQAAILEEVRKIIHAILVDNVSLRADVLVMLKKVNDIGYILNNEQFEEEQSNG